MFHQFNSDISGIPLPERFTYPFCYKPHPLTVAASRQVEEYLSAQTAWHEEIGCGKMFGVLVVADADGRTGFLAAYSGNIAGGNKHPYFVPPVYDMLQPDGFFKRGEAEISAINQKIEEMFASGPYREATERAEAVKRAAASRIESYLSEMRESKRRRDALRESGKGREEELIAESRFQKAELRRLKQRMNAEIADAQAVADALSGEVQALRQERKRRSAELQRRLFDSFRMLNAHGGSCGLCEIFEKERRELPPAGAGECAAPKLLQYAYLHGMRPLAMGEFWWGESPAGEIRRHGQFYPSCKGKCEPILHFMLQGLDVEPEPFADAQENPEHPLKTVYEDSSLWVVDKPAGMLSVPGKSGAVSVCGIARRRFPEAGDIPTVVHRLDMHTSGLLVVAKTAEAYRHLQRQFAERTVEKRYDAVLDGIVVADEGEIRLPLRPDFEHRPQQMADFSSGKEAVTRYRVLRRDACGTTRVAFFPITGRTHQLRVHAAHPAGLGAPIKGDLLYGISSGRLCLHASSISFVHPDSGERMTFTSDPDF